MEVTINGSSYDISEFQHQHPGGAFILQPFIGKDATHIFTAFHSKQAYDVLAGLPLVTKAKQAGGKAGKAGAGAGAPQQPKPGFDDAMHQLRGRFVAEGLFQGSLPFYTYKVLELHVLLAASLLLLWWQGPGVSSLVLGLFFQQAGWLAHDFLHQAVFKEHKWNYRFGNWYLGNLLQGFSAVWWNGKHFRHHAIPNGYFVGEKGEVVCMDKDVETDPLVVWVPFLAHRVPEFLWTWVLPHQHLYTWVLIIFSKLVWNLKSMMVCLKTGGYISAALIMVHYAAFLAAGAAVGGSLRAGAAWYAGGMAVGGFLLAFVFVQSHTGTSVIKDNSVGFYSAQVLTTRNVSTDPLTTWFTGGLNFQIEHHLFPRMPRHSYPKIKDRVRSLCEQYGLKYEELSMLTSTLVVARYLYVLGRPKGA